MKQSGILAACAVVCASSVASAQAGGMTTGGFELECYRIDGSSSLILDGDIDLRAVMGRATGIFRRGFKVFRAVAHVASIRLQWGHEQPRIGLPRL